jgi:uncharacterized protein (UPF0303 family)
VNHDILDSERLMKDINEISEDEKLIVFDEFTHDTAWELGKAALEEAKACHAQVTIDIRKGEHILFHYSMPGTVPNNDLWVERKTNTVQLLHKSTYRVGLENQLKQGTMASRQYLDPADYADHAGAFPITLSNAGVIGAIAVSGLPQRDDHDLVVRVLKKYLKLN